MVFTLTWKCVLDNSDYSKKVFLFGIYGTKTQRQKLMWTCEYNKQITPTCEHGRESVITKNTTIIDIVNMNLIKSRKNILPEIFTDSLFFILWGRILGNPKQASAAAGKGHRELLWSRSPKILTLSNFFYITLLKISDQETVKNLTPMPGKALGTGANIDLIPWTA